MIEPGLGCRLVSARNFCHQLNVMSIIDGRKSKRGRPRVNATAVQVRLPPAQLASLDDWIGKQPDPKPSRPEAIRQILKRQIDG